MNLAQDSEVSVRTHWGCHEDGMNASKRTQMQDPAEISALYTVGAVDALTGVTVIIDTIYFQPLNNRNNLCRADSQWILELMND